MDFQELYRYLVDDFIIQYCQKLKPKDFTTKFEWWNRKIRSKREYLNDSKTRELLNKLNDYFRRIVKVQRIMRGSKQETETLINEKALLFAKYLRNETSTVEGLGASLALKSGLRYFKLKVPVVNHFSSRP